MSDSNSLYFSRTWVWLIHGPVMKSKLLFHHWELSFWLLLQNPGLSLSETWGYRREDTAGGWFPRCGETPPVFSWEFPAAVPRARKARVHWKHRRSPKPHAGHWPCAQHLPLERRAVHDAVCWRWYRIDFLPFRCRVEMLTVGCPSSDITTMTGRWWTRSPTTLSSDGM